MSRLYEILPVADQYIQMAATGLITLGKGRLSLAIVTGGSADSVVRLYDGRDDSGPFILRMEALLDASNDFDFRYAIQFNTGLYAVLEGSGAKFFLSWLPIE